MNVRETARAETTCAARVEEAKTSRERRIPAEGLRVILRVPSSCVATVKVRVFFVRVKTTFCVVVVPVVHGAVTSCSAAVSAAAVGYSA